MCLWCGFGVRLLWCEVVVVWFSCDLSVVCLWMRYGVIGSCLNCACDDFRRFLSDLIAEPSL